MIPVGGCPLSSQTPMHLLPQEGPSRAVGFKAKKAEWRFGTPTLQEAEGTGILSTHQQEPESGTQSPKGEQGELFKLKTHTHKLISLKKN